MTVGYDSIFNDITFLNFSALCQQSGLPENRNIGMPSPDALGGRELFYDPLVRVPDYVAGGISRLDYKARVLTSAHKKHLTLVEKFASDNTNLAIIQMMESMLGIRAANKSLWSSFDRKALLANMDRDQILDCLVAKSFGFRKVRRRFRARALSSASGMDETSYQLSALMRGVAAGHPGAVATFTRSDRGGH